VHCVFCFAFLVSFIISLLCVALLIVHFWSTLLPFFYALFHCREFNHLFLVCCLPCYPFMEFSSTFFSCTSLTTYGVICRFPVVHSWCSFKLCLVPFQIGIYPSIFLMWKHGRRFVCNFFFNYQSKLQVTFGHIKG
jgi:hypothetical protein